MFGFIKRLFSRSKKLATRPPWPSDSPEFYSNFAENISAFFRGKNLISGTIGSLFLKFYEPIEREKEYRDDYKLEYLLNVQPNPFMNGMTFKTLLTNWMLSKGDGYAEKVFIEGELSALFPIHPDTCTPELKNNTLRYIIRSKDGSTKTLDQESVFHIHCYSDDGIKGKSVLEYGRQSFDLTYQLESFGLDFFDKGINPAGFLLYPGELDEPAEKRLVKSFERKYGGRRNRFGIIVLEEGMEFKPSSITPEQAQFLGSRKFQLYEIARWLGVPPHLLYELERATFSNIEHQSLDFLAYSIRFWLELWKSAIKMQLVDPLEDLFPEFSTDDLVLIDAKTKHEIAKSDKYAGVKNTNEIRAEFGYRSIGPAGDIYLYPTNFANAESFLDTTPKEPKEPEEPDTKEPGEEPDEPDTPETDLPEVPDSNHRRNGRTMPKVQR